MRPKYVSNVPSKHLMLLVIQVCLILFTSHSVLSEDCECGRSPASRILNGYEASREDFPWMVEFFSTKKGGGHVRCGASMISTQYAVTAAHCVPEDSKDHYLAFGYPDFEKVSKSPPNVEKVIVKSRHNLFRRGGDIAVVKASEPFEVVPICLPGSDNSFAGVTATMLGYGRTNEGDERKILRAGDIVVPSNEECAEVQEVASSQMCGSVYGGGPAFCKGDSGSPLMYYDNSARRWLLIGVISSNYGCNNTKKYGMLTRVTSWVPWIEENTDNAGCEVIDN